MPKRNNPFGDHSSLQLKTHVGEKEVDKGVCQQTRMQTVYERTQALLFKGMKSNAESAMVVDVNDNHAITQASGEGYGENPDLQNPSLKQLHLNRNCELVDCEEREPVDMDTDFHVQANYNLAAAPKMPSTFVFDTSASGACATSTVPPFGLNFGRNSDALSPASSDSHDHQVGQALGPSSRDAFALLMQSHSKNNFPNEKSCCQACHNCRQPVQAQRVLKCQFCEQYICSSCVRQCKGCFLHYCQLCSVVNYDQISERAFCLTCSGR